ncbi:VOC family protein [Nocardioides litoris]|uniref:VOC family protein n=1 Tax=Nocardioides litoris TaxID=1926648 RepID=UPI0011210A79|nr:VOC family protein [Nocardioides litoris]
MTLATWHGLVIEAHDVDAQSRFWADVLGLVVAGPVEDRRLEGETPRHTVRVVETDRPHEPKTAKNRVHPDLDCGSVEEVVAHGGRVLAPAEETGFAWTTMHDPEGNELCAFARPGRSLPAYRLHGLGIDCVDPGAQAAWWGEVLGVEVEHQRGDHGDEWWTLTGAAVDARMTLDFNAVPEPRTERSRVRWNVVGDVDALLSRGATRLADGLLADPEGNPFGVVPSRMLGA